MSTEEQATETTADASGCQVDWSWLKGREIAAVTSNLDRLIVTFTDGETLTVQASLWKGQAFLAFSPWRMCEA